MKHILPILTITTLAAAASAQSAAASSGLSYNRVGLDYDTDTKGYTLSASAMIGGSNFLVEAETTVGGNGNGDDSVSLGYVFKNVALGADATLLVGSNESYGLNVRKDLGSNIEVAVGYARSGAGVEGWGVELAYNVSKQIQLAVGISNNNVAGSSSNTDISVRYNF
ncbi:MAG: hypothetical protein CK541_02985 [Opitutia bacterium]|nr:hypothetical protein [Opitutales bacterium]PHX79808.1 MAG: hypothetical protein CK541_02985 [Opitutae bacterium]